MKRPIVAAAALAVSLRVASAGTLDTVRQRGELVCGASVGFAGLSARNTQGDHKGRECPGRARAFEPCGYVVADRTSAISSSP